MRISRILIPCLLVSLLASCASTPIVEEKREAEFHYKMGLSYSSEGDTQKAFVSFQQALQKDPNNKDILNNLGLIYITLDNPEAAKELFLKAVSIDPDFSDAYNNLGVVYTRTGKWQEAIDSFRKALANPLYQNPERAFYNLGTAYYRIGQASPAIDAFRDALRRAPGFPLPYYGLALACNKAGRFGDAASAIARAVEIDTAYQGDKGRFEKEVRERLVSATGTDETDLRDYLEILRY